MARPGTSVALLVRRALSRSRRLRGASSADADVARSVIFQHHRAGFWCGGWVCVLSADGAGTLLHRGGQHSVHAVAAAAPGATEAMYLMARHVFDDLGYRRYEWKCNSLNAPSRRAALRLGFSFEGIFRQHMIIKGRNRDTAWYAMLDSEWPDRKRKFERWLTASNFEARASRGNRSGG